MSPITLSADVFLTLDRSKEQQQTRVNTRFKAEAKGLRLVMVVVLLMTDVGCGIISTSGSAAAKRAVVATDSWNNNIIKMFFYVLERYIMHLTVSARFLISSGREGE